jgi:hypothetical protein
MTLQNTWQDSAYYHIKVKGLLSNRWRGWFEGMTIKSKNGVTKISGRITDQAALHGLLVRIRDLGLILISVTRDESR